MRLDFALANAGVGSRKEIKSLIARRKVTVNGELASNGAMKIQESDNVEVFGLKVNLERYVYLMINKPKGYVCTNDVNENSVLELIPSEHYRKDLFCVGRLDKDTTGLLLVTNDGDFAHSIISPKRHKEKVYIAKVKNPVTQEDIQAFAHGIFLADGEETLPAVLEKTSDEKTVKVILCEGKYHQVKRMFASRSNFVEQLHRTQVGEYKLPEDLPIGKVRIIEKTSHNIR